MTVFADLHRPGVPFVLPNAWDVYSALMLEESGFPAVATTSQGVNAAAGLADATGRGLAETLRLAELLTGRLKIPLSIDFEGGFSEDPAEVAANCRRLADLGVAGVNLEDANRSPQRHSDVIAAVAASCPELFINARTDVYWLQLGPASNRPQETATRLARYEAAGAHGVFVPGLNDPQVVGTLTQTLSTPLNLLWSPGCDRAALAQAGVARFSTGSSLFRAAMSAARDLARTAAGWPPLGHLTYADVQQTLE